MRLSLCLPNALCNMHGTAQHSTHHSPIITYVHEHVDKCWASVSKIVVVFALASRKKGCRLNTMPLYE